MNPPTVVDVTIPNSQSTKSRTRIVVNTVTLLRTGDVHPGPAPHRPTLHALCRAGPRTADVNVVAVSTAILRFGKSLPNGLCRQGRCLITQIDRASLRRSDARGRFHWSRRRRTRCLAPEWRLASEPLGAWKHRPSDQGSSSSDGLDSWQDGDGTLGMRVELPRLLSVFAHELRGPLSVIQGYLRLMLRQRDDSHTETPMIRAMLDATGRLATLARQASDVAVWCNPNPPTGEVTVAALAEKTAALVPSGAASVTLDDHAGLDAVRTSDQEALAAALAALAESAARETGGRVNLSSRSVNGQRTVAFVVSPAGATTAPGTDPAVSSPRPATVAFDRGGFGLSLVLASYVLDAHGADVLAADAAGTVEVRLQKAGGSR